MSFSNFAKRVKELRKEQKITQDTLAVDIGVTKETVSVWERGLRVAEQNTINKLAEYFNVSVAYLMGFSDAKQVYIDDTELESWRKSERIDAVQALAEMLAQLDDSSLAIMGAAIAEAYKQDKNKGRLEDKSKFYIKVDSMAIVEANAQLEGMENKQL